MNEAAPPSTIGRKLLIVFVCLIVLIGGWTGGWFWLKGEAARRMDDQLERLATRGIAITCPDRTIGGWPFRFDIDCSNPTLTQPSRLTSVALKHLRLTTLVYQPTLVILELDGPLAATGPNGESIHAVWTQLQASIGLTLSPAIRPQRLSVAVDGLTAGAARPGSQEVKLTTTHAELHTRPAPDANPGAEDIDIAASLAAATVSIADRPIGPEATDWTLAAVARNLPASLVEGQSAAQAWAENLGRLDLRAVRMTLGAFALNGQGSLSIGLDGLLGGQIKLVASGLGSIMAPTAASLKGRAELIGLATAFTLFGKPVQDPSGTAPAGRGLDMTIEQGRIKVGPTAFGHIPPLF